MPASSLEEIVSLCKRRGFIFPGSDIYGGLANTWDYGPLGAELKKRVRDHWWREFVHKRSDIVGLDSSILMNPKVWEASGHVTSFNDPLVDCKNCKERFRGDHLLEKKMGTDAVSVLILDQIQPMLVSEKINCPSCGNCDWTEAKQFNLMFKTQQGVIEGEGDDIFLRPETAQGIFVNFKNIVQTMRMRLPFGVAQVGKAFRNEITPGNFTYRTREFEQMEIEYFVEPDDGDSSFSEWQDKVVNWYKDLGISDNNLRVREHSADELSHYSTKTIDIEYQFPWGWGELFGLAHRGDYDLSKHEEVSGEDLKYSDPVLTLLLEAYTEEEVEGSDVRTVMRFDKRIAPVDVAVLPLSKKEPLIAKAKEVFDQIAMNTNFVVDFDITGSIGKRYRRQDEIGTPLAITVDFGTIGEDKEQGAKDTVTIRNRDTLEQDRVSLTELVDRLKENWEKF